MTAKQPSAFGFGCSSYWCNTAFPISQASRLVELAFDLGVNYFDTGGSYNNGNAEIRLGDAVKKLPRKELFISTKVGTVVRRGRKHKSFTTQNIRQSISESLERLQCQTLDIVYLHGPSEGELEQARKCLASAVPPGSVKHLGVNSFNPAVIKAAVCYPEFSYVMFEHNPLTPNHDLILEATSNGTAVVTATAVGQQLCSSKLLIPTTRKHIWYLARAILRNRSKLQSSYLTSFPRQLDGLSRAQLFLLYQKLNTSIQSSVFGTTSEQHLRENVAMLTHTPTDNVRKALAEY